MKKLTLPFALLAIVMFLAACNNKKTQNETKTTETAQVEDPAATRFYEQLSFEKFLDYYTTGEVTLEDCGLKLIYEDSMESEDGDAGMYLAVYGWGVEKGEKLDFGYDLKTTSDRACYLESQEDTSLNHTFFFKDKADADRFFQQALDYGMVIDGDTYCVPAEKLPNGSVKGSIADYNILMEISKPELDGDFYKISIYFYV